VAPSSRIVVTTGEVLGARMAGPAIRAWQMARALSAEHDVVLAGTRGSTLTHPDFRIVGVDPSELTALVAGADVLVVQGDLLGHIDPGDTVVIVDLYDPFHLEALEQTAGLAPDLRHRALWTARHAIDQQIRRGDRFLCASNRQRDFWLGHLAAAGRINELTYAASPDLEALITVVPFGVEDRAPKGAEPVLRGVAPGVGADDLIVMWGGGIYDWFDPLTLLRALDRVRVRVPSVKLFFAGMRHPNPEVGETAMARETRALSDELGLTGSHVIFNDWVEYDARERYLLEADVAVSTHFEHIETAFSFRTRVLDYLWASLPVVTTRGDEIGEVVTRAGAGLAVPPADVDALEAALLTLLEDPELRARSAAASGALARDYRWSVVLEPLLAFCRAPVRAPDLVDPQLGREIAAPSARPPRIDAGAKAGRVWDHLRRGEISTLVEKARGHLRRRGLG
jgi:glycosyltransferase involved in cell wall biosynthesis